MAVSEKAKEKLDEASKEIKGAIENLGQDVAELGNKVKERLNCPSRLHVSESRKYQYAQTSTAVYPGG